MLAARVLICGDLKNWTYGLNVAYIVEERISYALHEI